MTKLSSSDKDENSLQSRKSFLLVKASTLREERARDESLIQGSKCFPLVKASQLYETEIKNLGNERTSIVSEKSDSSRTSSPPVDFETPLTAYLHQLLPRSASDSWTREVIWENLREAYVILPRGRLRITNKPGIQRDFFYQYSIFPNPIPHTNVSTLAQMIKCREHFEEPASDRVCAGTAYHDYLKDRFEDVSILLVQTDELDKILAEGSIQIREQFLEDQNLNLAGRPDHFLLTEMGFVVREDKLSSRQWNQCYLSAVFQLHVYAFLLQALYPHLPCRALQICVHTSGEATCQVFTFPPAWDWFLPHLAQSLLHSWGYRLREFQKLLRKKDESLLPTQQRFLRCWEQRTPNSECSACNGKSNCLLVESFPFDLTPESASRDDLEMMYQPESESPSEWKLNT
ncbi:MAG: hypothetical protein ACFFBD_10190 [Candidatus Hodarchaeota archaeon]